MLLWLHLFSTTIVLDAELSLLYFLSLGDKAEVISVLVEVRARDF
jgi:hypothetical protein